VHASDEQIGAMLSGDAQDFAIGLTGGEYRVHGRGGTHMIRDSVCKTGPAFLFRQHDVLPKTARAGKHSLMYLARNIGRQLDHMDDCELCMRLPRE
jgi:hypothetical protein